MIIFRSNFFGHSRKKLSTVWSTGHPNPFTYMAQLIFLVLKTEKTKQSESHVHGSDCKQHFQKLSFFLIFTLLTENVYFFSENWDFTGIKLETNHFGFIRIEPINRNINEGDHKVDFNYVPPSGQR